MDMWLIYDNFFSDLSPNHAQVPYDEDVSEGAAVFNNETLREMMITHKSGSTGGQLVTYGVNRKIGKHLPQKAAMFPPCSPWNLH